MATAEVPPSPGVGARRSHKAGRAPPRLPLSAFSPPNSSASDSFPIPASPSTQHPAAPVDAHAAPGAGYRARAGDVLGARAAAIVVRLDGPEAGGATALCVYSCAAWGRR
jgi:hypothetical protein